MKKSFTLIELLIVIIIIGVLATLAIPQYQKFIEKARKVEALIVLNSWCKQAFIYYQETGKFPSPTGGDGVFLTSQVLDEMGATAPPSNYWNYLTGEGTYIVYGGKTWIGIASAGTDPNEYMTAFYVEEKADVKHEINLRVRKDGMICGYETWDNWQSHKLLPTN